MSKHLLEITKRDFVQWFETLPNDKQYQLMTTGFNAKTQVARFRRLYLRTFNSLNWQTIRTKPELPSRFGEYVKQFDKPKADKPSMHELKQNPFKCRHCVKRFVSLKRRRTHERKYHD